jgi:ABC-type multidrug transport system ATPase subunit
LYLDEPTTGLDSSVSKDIMLYLKDITRKTGLTVATIIHQPRYDIIRECDDLVLLGKGGRTVYSGPADKALEYFDSIGFKCPEHANPAGIQFMVSR